MMSSSVFVQATSRASPFASIATHDPTRRMPSGVSSDGCSLKAAPNSTIAEPTTAVTAIAFQGMRAGPAGESRVWCSGWAAVQSAIVSSTSPPPAAEVPLPFALLS